METSPKANRREGFPFPADTAPFGAKFFFLT